MCGAAVLADAMVLADWTKVLKRAVGTNISETISEVIFAHLMSCTPLEMDGSSLFCIDPWM